MIKHDAGKDEYSVTMRSPINIALVKYWGKAHEKLIIPTNNSLSLTINKADLCSTTTVTISRATKKAGNDSAVTLILNETEQKGVSERITRVVKIIQDRAKVASIKAKSKSILVRQGNKIVSVPLKDLVGKTEIRVESVNNFATAAGLASSASGLACLARCIAAVYGIEESFEGEFSMYARLGSGSACRSLYGGVVEWKRGYDSESELEN